VCARSGAAAAASNTLGGSGTGEGEGSGRRRGTGGGGSRRLSGESADLQNFFFSIGMCIVVGI